VCVFLDQNSSGCGNCCLALSSSYVLKLVINSSSSSFLFIIVSWQ